MLLQDKVVIVSGIGPGLGVKLAVEAAREGARGVVLAARSAAKRDDAETRIRALGMKCRAIKVPTDITDAAQRTRLHQRPPAPGPGSTNQTDPAPTNRAPMTAPRIALAALQPAPPTALVPA